MWLVDTGGEPLRQLQQTGRLFALGYICGKQRIEEANLRKIDQLQQGESVQEGPVATSSQDAMGIIKLVDEDTSGLTIFALIRMTSQ